MKDISEIKDRLSDKKESLDSDTGPLYECAGDYLRGWVSALEWVLDPAGARREKYNSILTTSLQFEDKRVEITVNVIDGDSA